MNVGMPPRSRNHLVPAACDTPTAAAASSLDTPLAISRQNSRSTPRRSEGFPGDFIAERPVKAFIQPAGLPINTSKIGVLRRAVESAEYTATRVRTACDRLGIRQSMGRPGSALDNAVIESWHSTLEFELRRLEHFTTTVEARAQVAAWIEDYNHDRRHSALGMLSPIAYERTHPTPDGPPPEQAA
jgi:transposase InsO family protein